MNQQERTFRPERSDSVFISDVLKAAFNARIGLVVVSIVTILLMVVIFILASRPQRVVVIDASSGRTYAALNKSGLAQDIIDRQLTYYSIQACEDYLNFDHMTIQQARQTIFDIAHPKFKESLPQNWLTNDPELRRCIDDRYSSYFDWEIIPRVTMRNDPYYSTFCVFTRIVKVNDVTKEVKKYNVKVDWGRLENNADYSKRPHSLVLLRISVLNQGSNEYNDQINQIK